MYQFKYGFKEMPYVLMAVLKMWKLVRKMNLETNTLSSYHISLILLKNKMVASIVLVRPGIVEIKVRVLKRLSLCFGHRHP